MEGTVWADDSDHVHLTDDVSSATTQPSSACPVAPPVALETSPAAPAWSSGAPTDSRGESQAAISDRGVSVRAGDHPLATASTRVLPQADDAHEREATSPVENSRGVASEQPPPWKPREAEGSTSPLAKPPPEDGDGGFHFSPPVKPSDAMKALQAHGTPAAVSAPPLVPSASTTTAATSSHTAHNAASMSAGGGNQRQQQQQQRHSSPSAVAPVPFPVTSTCSAEDWSTRPRLGFPPSKSPDVQAAERAAQPSLTAFESRSEAHWHSICRGVSLLASSSPETVYRLRKSVRRYGVPRHLRGVMWATLTGVALKVDENEYFCRELLVKNGYVKGGYGDAIEADLERTFPGHPYFSQSDVGLYKLKNVLHALCWRNPLLSYCQSFNYLSGFLLLVLDDEERTFWLLAYLLEVLLPNDFYSESLLGAKVDQVVLEALVVERLPRIAKKFAEVGFEVGALLPAWVMAMFVNTFPVETVLRVWDYILVESPHPSQRTSAHLEITLAALKVMEGTILSCEDSGEVMVRLHEEAAKLYDAGALLHVARRMSVGATTLHNLRRRVKPLVVQEIHEREELRATMRERRLARELAWELSQASPSSGGGANADAPPSPLTPQQGRGGGGGQRSAEAGECVEMTEMNDGKSSSSNSPRSSSLLGKGKGKWRASRRSRKASER